MVNRLIEPTSGRILIGETDVMQRDVIELRRGIGYVIQQVGLFPHQTVGENVATVPRLLGWDEARRRARAEELLELVGLDPARYADRYPAALSGGERQRVGVARALAADPPVMLMDEPFGAVDPIVRERLQNEFLRPPGAARQDDPVRDPRHRRGDQDGRPRRGHAGRRRARPVRARRTRSSRIPPPTSWPGSSARIAGLKRLSLLRVGELELTAAVTAHPGEDAAEPARPCPRVRRARTSSVDDGRPADRLGRRGDVPASRAR